jgi:hypothetical protein
MKPTAIRAAEPVAKPTFGLYRKTPYWTAGFYMGRVFTAVRVPCDDAFTANSVSRKRNNTMVPSVRFLRHGGESICPIRDRKTQAWTEAQPPACGSGAKLHKMPGGSSCAHRPDEFQPVIP